MTFEQPVASLTANKGALVDPLSGFIPSLNLGLCHEI